MEHTEIGVVRTSITRADPEAVAALSAVGVATTRGVSDSAGDVTVIVPMLGGTSTTNATEEDQGPSPVWLAVRARHVYDPAARGACRVTASEGSKYQVPL